MSKRTAEASRKIRLLKLMEENNQKSPDILAAITVANSQMEAWRIAIIFEEVTGEDLPFYLDEWERSVRPPVELYFVFKRKKDLGRFVRMMSREFPDNELFV